MIFPLPLPTKTCIHARTEVWKEPPFHELWKKTNPLFTRNRWFWDAIKHPFLKRNATFSFAIPRDNDISFICTPCNFLFSFILALQRLTHQLRDKMVPHLQTISCIKHDEFYSNITHNISKDSVNIKSQLAPVMAWQQCCRCACQICKRYDNLKYQSRGFETLRDLTEWRLFGYWDGAQGADEPLQPIVLVHAITYQCLKPDACLTNLWW